MAWWEQNPEAWQACRADPRDPGTAMNEYRTWLEALPGKPTFVGYPAAYDFMFVYWYLIRFTGGSPFSHSALGPARHTHVALDDAIEQGELWLAMCRAARARA